MNKNYCILPRWECELLSGDDQHQCPTHRPVYTTAPTTDPVQAVYKKYADAIDKMYEQRTRGDYSSIGILSEFARELREVEAANV